MVVEHDRVVLKRAIPESGLEAGDVGTVVHVYADREGFEVEFVALDGQTEVVTTVRASDVRSVRAHEMAHARSLAVA